MATAMAVVAALAAGALAGKFWRLREAREDALERIREEVRQSQRRLKTRVGIARWGNPWEEDEDGSQYMKIYVAACVCPRLDNFRVEELCEERGTLGDLARDLRDARCGVFPARGGGGFK